MYTITYRNVLQPDKAVDDFEQWLSFAWDIQKQWGAEDVQYVTLQEKEDQICICRYSVSDIDLWNRSNTGPEAISVIRALGEVVDITRTSMKVTVSASGLQ